VLAANVLTTRLSAVTVVLVTSTRGPEITHIPLDADAGMSKRHLSYANATDLHTVPLSRFRRRRGALSVAEIARLEEAVRLVLDL